MPTRINAKKQERIKALVHKQLSKHSDNASENVVRLSHGVNRDGEDILYIFAISNEFSPSIPHISISETMNAIIDYLNANDMPHIPIPYEITTQEWPAFKRGFMHAITDAD